VEINTPLLKQKREKKEPGKGGIFNGGGGRNIKKKFKGRWGGVSQKMERPKDAEKSRPGGTRWKKGRNLLGTKRPNF